MWDGSGGYGREQVESNEHLWGCPGISFYISQWEGVLWLSSFGNKELFNTHKVTIFRGMCKV